jgi:hypothetical protein
MQTLGLFIPADAEGGLRAAYPHGGNFGDVEENSTSSWTGRLS